ncbi:MAG: dolichyl-phosphate beta-D-mannosyltransferase [Gammaproteobacteria bacterium HGW-Gammaproteobacteria-8]|nr:MAG: dolichyl-phosphate beta-D-mannosyltransferase [Gammaproteobacteria bacterium HGW-Gammaproteobacteria-8]
MRMLERPGQTPDLTASVLAAARAARGRFCVVMDADGSHPVEAVPRLLQAVQSGAADLAVGSRHVAGGEIADWPRWRRLVSRAAALVAWPYTRVSDPMSGFFATTTARLASLEPLVAGYKVLLEVLVRTRPEARVVEVPIRFNDRGHGSSKMNLRVQWLFLRRLAALGGARLTLSNLSRFSLVGLSGMLVDLTAFWLLRGFGAGLASAHFTGFLLATISNFALNRRFSFTHEMAERQPAAQRYFAFLVVALLALALRGGVLAVLTGGLGLAGAWAIVPAVVATAAINYFGSIFYVFPARRAEQNAEIRWRLAALALIALSLALRWLYLGQAELIFDEMYYWVYTLHPALSYLDHPPLTAWLIAAGTAVFGDTALGVRAATLLLGPLALLFAYLYCRDLTDKTRGLIGAMLIAVVPAWMATGMLMTTDCALVTAWLAALYFMQRALLHGRQRAWIGAGVAIGLGALAKYSMVFLVPGIALLMLTQRPARAALRSPWAWAGGAIALLLFSPVLVWNHANDWASFAFQSTRRIAEQPEFSSHLLPLQTVIALGPLAGLALLWLLLRGGRNLGVMRPERHFMLAMTIAPLLVLVLFGATTAIKFHWIVPAWLAMLPLLATSLHPPAAARPDRVLRALQRAWKPLLPLSLAAAGLGLHYVSLGLPGVGWQPNRLGYMGWQELAVEVHNLETRIEAETGQRPIVAGMAKWGISAALSFHDVDGRRDNITARNLVGMGGSQWELWFDPQTDPDRPVLLVSHEPKLIDEEWLERALIGLGPLQTRTVTRNGMPIQVLHYRIGAGFRPEMLRYPGHIPE